MKNFNQKTLGIFLLCLVTSGVSLFFFDQKVSFYFGDSSRENVWLMAREITNIGLSSHYLIFSLNAIIFLYLWGRFAKTHPHWRRPLFHWSAQFFMSLLVSGVVTLFFKFLFGRQRPHLAAPDYHPWTFDFLNLHWNFQSLPSGHSQVLFCVATMLAILAPRGAWFFFVLAAGFAFTRVITHSHFISDCIWGAFVGWYFTRLTSMKYAKILKDRKGLDIRY